MPTVSAYHRPATVDEALALLDHPGATPLAGGTALVPARRATPVGVVDLQALGLDAIAVDGDRLRIGAMATLQAIADHPLVPEVLRSLARRELPSTLRSLATLGGTIAEAEADSEVLAALLVHGAVVEVAGGSGTRNVTLADLLADPTPLQGSIIVAVEISATGSVSVARTARTPADRPIVAAVARRAPGGEVTVALTGVAASPVVVGSLDALDPPGDFRGSSEYRRHLAATLTARVMSQATQEVA